MANQQIIALSGKKGSGKSTSCNFMIGLHMLALGLVKENFRIDPSGGLNISDINGDKDFEGIFDVNRGTPAMEVFLADNLDPYVKLYSFADLLKTEVCMKILGLTYEQCYGTNEQKDSLTGLKWEDMPGVITEKTIENESGNMLPDCFDEQSIEEQQKGLDRLGLIYHKSGYMTSRETLQYFGSNVMRRAYNSVWVDATLRRIQGENAACAIICDCRFPNEVEGVQKAGGKVVRLTRSPYEDIHLSETPLDEGKFDWNKFDLVIKNENLTIDESNTQLYKKLKEWGALPIELEEMEK